MKVSIEGQGNFITLFFPGFVCFCLYEAQRSGERLQDHRSSGYKSDCTPVRLTSPKFWKHTFKKDSSNTKLCFCLYILTYRNNPSFTSMGILIFLSLCSNTDQIRMKLRVFQAHLMGSRNQVLTYSWTS